MILPRQNEEASGEDVKKRKGEHDFPAQVHELVIAETRERPAHKEKKDAEENDFSEKRSDLKKAYKKYGKRNLRAAGKNKT